MNALLDIVELRLTLGEFTLGPLSLALARGDYMVLLGPSGCGKTSLLKAIAGVYPVGPGHVYVGGRDIGRLPPQRRHISYVAQAVDLFPHMDVAQNVAFGLRYLKLTRGEKRQRFERITGLLGLSSLLQRRPANLSGGEGKRVALARSLAVDPHMLLLDEPLSMLDPNARTAMLEVLKAAHDELGTATVHVTHDREEAWMLGGTCAVMREGVIEQVGRVDGLFRRPRSRFVAEFLGGANVFPARFKERGGKWFAVLEWAEFELAGAPGFESGYVQIRPGDLVPSAQGSISGTVLSVADRGVYSEAWVQGPQGSLLRVHLASSASSALQAGERVRLCAATPPHPIEG